MSNVSVTLGLKNAGFKRGLDEARGQVRSFKADIEKGGGLLGLGSMLSRGIATLGVGLAIRKAVDFAGSMQDSADALGLNVERLQQLRGAFGEFGVGSETFDKAFSTLVQKIEAAKDGNAEAALSFQKLGVSMTDLQTKGPDAIMMAVADAAKQGAQDGATFAAVMDVMGKGGLRMSAGLKQGSEALEDLSKKIAVVSSGDIAALDAIGDAASRVAGKINGLVSKSIVGLAIGVDRISSAIGLGKPFNAEANLAAGIAAASAPVPAHPGGTNDAREKAKAAALAKYEETLQNNANARQLDKLDAAKKRAGQTGAQIAADRAKASQDLRDQHRAEREIARQTEKEFLKGRRPTDQNRQLARKAGAAEITRLRDLRDPDKRAAAELEKAMAPLAGELATVNTNLANIERKIDFPR